MAERKYSIHFLTSAELGAAKATEQAVERIGTATDKSKDKLDQFEQEWKARLDGIRQKLESSRTTLEKGGEEAGQGAGRGMGKGLELAANMHLIQQAWSIGSMIGAKLGEALVAAHEGGLEDLTTSLLSGLGVWSAQVEEELERQKQTQPAKHREINEKIVRENKLFWDKMLGLQPKTATDWMDQLIIKSDQLTAKLRGIAEVQTAVMKIGQSQVQQDYLDKRQDIELSSDPESVKARKMGSLEQWKLEQEAALRRRQRLDQGATLTGGLSAKEAEVQAMRDKEAEQQRRADAYSKAENMANSEIQTRRSNGQQVTEMDALKIKEQFFKQESQRSGVNLDINTNEKSQWQTLKAKREKMELELEKLRADTLAKQHVLALEEANDAAVTAREKDRVFRESENRATQSLRKERDQQEQEKQQREAYERDNLPKPPETPPVDANLERLRGQIGQASQATGNSGLKIELEGLNRALADGASAEELKQAAALLNRAAADSNDGVRQIAAAMRESIQAMAASQAALKAEVAQIKITTENLRTN